MKTISRAFYVKKGSNWEQTYYTEDAKKVYEDITAELMNHKVFHVPYIKRMEQYSNYDGTRTVTFYEEHGKSVYIIKA